MEYYRDCYFLGEIMYNIQYRLKPIDDDIYWNGYYVYVKGSHFFIKDPSYDADHDDLDISSTWEIGEGDILEVLISNVDEPSYWKQIDTSIPVYKTNNHASLRL